METGIATVAADGRLIIDQTDPPRVLTGEQTPVRSAVAVAVVNGVDWEIGSGLLRGTAGEKRPDGSRVETLAVQRISVVKSSRGGRSLDLGAGEIVEVRWLPDTGHFLPQVAELEKSIAGGE